MQAILSNLNLQSDIGVLWICERAFIDLHVFVLFKSSIGSAFITIHIKSYSLIK
jgi:hypothetical protein